MMARTQQGRQRMLVSLRQGIFAFGGLFLAIAAVLGAQVVFKNSEAAAAEQQARVERQQIQIINTEIRKASGIKSSKVPSDLSAVAHLQSAIERLAQDRHCAVADFRASSDATPYLTRFAKTTSVSGWSQVETQMSLAGSLQDVMAALTGLIREDIPLEFDSMEITRDKVDSEGDASVIAHVTLRVLIRAKGAA